MDIRNQQYIDLEAHFQLVNLLAFFVEQEGRDIDRHLCVNRAGAFFHRFFLNDAQDMQGRGCGIANVTQTVAAWAGDIARFRQRRLQALARELQETETGNLAGLHAGAVVAQSVAQAVFNFALVLGRFHIDEIDDDQTTEIAQPQLAGDFVSRFAVGAEGRFFDVVALGRAGGVHVDRHQGFGVVDDDGATRWQGHVAPVGGFDLVLDLKAREQRHVVFVELDLAHIGGHHGRHKRLRLLENFRRIDENFADIGLEQIADRAYHEARFEIDQLRRFDALGGAIDGFPQLHEVAQIPLELFSRAADTGGAGDDTHAFGDIELIQGLAQFGALFTLHPARNTATAWVIGHQYQIATGQRDVGGKGRTLVAPFVFFDLHQQLLTHAQVLSDAATGAFAVFTLHILAGELFERQKAVALGAVIDKYRFERGLNAGDFGFVDIAFALFLPGMFNIEIDQLLTVDDGNSKLFGLGCVK